MKALAIAILMVCACANFVSAQNCFCSKNHSAKVKKKNYIRSPEIGIEIGRKVVTPSVPSFHFFSSVTDNQEGNGQTSIGMNYFMKTRHRIRFGISLYSDGYSFEYTRKIFIWNFSLRSPYVPQTAETDITAIDRYLFIAPVLDITCGKRSHSHFYYKPAAGILLSGSQQVHSYGNIMTNDLASFYKVSPYDHYENTSDEVSRLVFETNIGFRREINLGMYWNISLDLSLSSMVNRLSSYQSPSSGVINLSPGAWRFTLGVNRKAGGKNEKK